MVFVAAFRSSAAYFNRSDRGSRILVARSRVDCPGRKGGECVSEVASVELTDSSCVAMVDDETVW